MKVVFGPTFRHVVESARHFHPGERNGIAEDVVCISWSTPEKAYGMYEIGEITLVDPSVLIEHPNFRDIYMNLIAMDEPKVYLARGRERVRIR